MSLDGIRQFSKEELSSGFISNMRERLKSAKVPFIVASTVATMGLYGLIDQSPINVSGNFQALVEAAKPKEADVKKYIERKVYLINRLTEIKAEIYKDIGVENYFKNMIDGFDDLIAECTDPYRKQAMEFHKELLSEYNPNESINFSNNKTSHTAWAQGQQWANPAPGLYFTIVDPNANKLSEKDSVKIPKMADNIVTIRIPTKHVYLKNRAEDLPENKIIYDNAMQYVYKFFENEITKEQLDNVIEEAIILGRDDKEITKVLTESLNVPKGSKEEKTIFTRIDLLRDYPKAQIKREFGGKQYTIKYDGFGGRLIIEFPMD